MTRLLLFSLLLIAACVVAGLYGALHNQISYTVSPDYFFAFKFRQFAIPEGLQNRVGASIVGWHASWWMGLFIGLPVLSIALIMPDWKTYLSYGLLSFAVVAVTALVVGLGGLVYACLAIPEAAMADYWCPAGVADRAAFVRAGVMHDCSYLGGGIGIITAAVFLVLARNRLVRRRQREQT